MKGHEKLVFFGLVAVFVVIIAVLIFRGGNNNQSTAQGQAEQTPTQSAAKEEFVEVVNGDVKLNTSDRLKETKTFDGLEISGIQLTSKGNTTQLLADVTNNTTSEKGGYAVKIVILDKAGQEITTLHGYIGKVAAGGKTQLSCSKTFDYANAYDFTIEKE